jgi:putative sterol carrier protein
MAAREFFESLESRADPGKLAGLEHSYLFRIEGEGTWLVAVHGGAVTVTEGEGAADVTIRASAETFDRIRNGKQNPVLAYATGKLKVDGDLGAATKLQSLFS